MELSCVICLNTMSSTDELEGTLCGHVCHATCMHGWLQRSLTCPQCRRHVRIHDIGRIYLNFSNSENSLMESVMTNHASELQNLQGLLQERDQYLRQRNQEIQQKDQQIHQKDQQIHQKDQQIHQKDQQIHQKDQQIQQKDQQLQEKAAIIANLDEEMKKKYQKDTEQMASIESLNKQIQVHQRELASNAEKYLKLQETVADYSKKLSEECAASSYYATQLAMQRDQQERILDLEKRNKWSADEAIAEMKRELTLNVEKCKKLEKCVTDYSKKFAEKCAKSSETEQLLRICVREKLELKARLDCLEKMLIPKEDGNVKSQNIPVVPKIEKNASKANNNRSTTNVTSNVEFERNLLQPKTEQNALESKAKTKKRASRLPLGTVNQNSGKSHYNLRPR